MMTFLFNSFEWTPGLAKGWNTNKARAFCQTGVALLFSTARFCWPFFERLDFQLENVFTKSLGLSIGAVLEQELLQLSRSSVKERSSAPRVPGIDVGVVVQQQLGCRRMTVLHREGEGSVALVVLPQNVCSDMTVRG